MDTAKADRILQRAIQKGLIHAEGLVMLDRVLARYGPRLGALIGVGRLDAEVARQIETELDAETIPEQTLTETVTVPALSNAVTHFVTGDMAPSVGLWTGKNCGRYEVADLLGRGGMGEVYRAYDPTLKRDVAIKFVLSEDPRLVERFLREAQLQARVEHENVCKVHEAAEFEGRPYIVMQLIDGRPLSQAQGDMTIEQKLHVMLRVAEAVHAAHRQGLIHRDLKPANVMVERMEDGRWKPCVMDFGLARDVQSTSKTTTGQAVGTPAYMSPEQARGERDRIDRRTDVYGLGATLYDLLAGRPPFDGESGVEVMMKLVQEEPARLRTLRPSIPVDVETVVMRCIEKDPSRRYATAQEVAEDLQRILNAEPIRARPTSWSYRTSKKVRRHKALAVVSVVALLTVAAAGASALHVRWTAAQRARASQEFGQDAARIDAIMREAYLLPLHDTRSEKAQVRSAMEGIDRQMKVVGSSAAGPGNFALGRGDMALGDFSSAQKHLQSAWDAGSQTVDAAAAMGLTLGSLYKERLDALVRIEDAKEREIERQRIEKELRGSAVGFLRKGAGATGVTPEYVEAVIALYERRLDEAMRKASESLARRPSLYAARIVQGDVHLELGNAARDRGEADAARTEYRQAETLYRDATRYGESDPVCYERLCALWTNLMVLDFFGSGGDLQADLKEAIRAGDAGLAADPDMPALHADRAFAWWKWGEYQYAHGQDPTDSYAHATASAREALRLQPSLLRAHVTLADAMRTQGEYDMSLGRDPTPSLRAAVESCQTAIRIDPRSAEAHASLGIAFNYLASYADRHGEDPMPMLEEAIRCKAKAVELSPETARFHSNLGNGYYLRAEYEMAHGLDPSGSLQAAIRSQEKAVAIKPDYAYGFNNLGAAIECRARYEMSRGRDPRETFKAAIEAFDKAISINASIADPYYNKGAACSTLGYYEDLTGADPSRSFRLADESFNRGMKVDANDPTLYVATAASSLLRARIELDAGRSPMKYVEDARGQSRKAYTIDPTLSGAHLCLGEAELIGARWRLREGQPADDFLKRSRIALQTARAEDAGDPAIYEAFASLCRSEAEALFARRKNAEPQVQEGIEMADKALVINPADAVAMAEKGALQLIRARSQRDTAARQDTAQKASDLLREALRTNKLLEREYLPVLNEVRKITVK